MGDEINKKIKMDLDITKVNKLCAICDALDFDVNVICGRLYVDGKSVMGVMEMCGRTVTLDPITYDKNELSRFFHQVEQLGAYTE